MKFHLHDIERIWSVLDLATLHVKEARRVARKVYSNDDEITTQLKYAYAEIQKAARLLEGKDA